MSPRRRPPTAADATGAVGAVAVLVAGVAVLVAGVAVPVGAVAVPVGAVAVLVAGVAVLVGGAAVLVAEAAAAAVPVGAAAETTEVSGADACPQAHQAPQATSRPTPGTIAWSGQGPVRRVRAEIARPR